MSFGDRAAKIRLNLRVAQERHELARGNGTITGCVRATNV